MFIMNYTEGTGWHDARVVPYAPLALDPAAMIMHYQQGMKWEDVASAFEGDMLEGAIRKRVSYYLNGC